MSASSQVFSHTRNTQAGYLCYVNGIEVPIIGASVSFGVGQIPEAAIQFFPSRLLHRFGAEDRVPVVLFYLDTHYDPDAPEYRLLFDGEIVGWSYSSTPGNRSISAQAVADISIMQQMNYGFLNTVNRIGEMAQGQSATTIPQAGAYYGYSLFQNGLIFDNSETALANTNGKPVPTIERPFELLYNATRALIDVNVPPKTLAIPVANFFRRWARKQNFHNKFIACPDFDEVPTEKHEVFPVLRAARSTAVLDILQNDVAAGSQDSVIYDLLSQLFNYVFCEIAMLPTAPCHRVNLTTGLSVGNSDASVGGTGESEERPKYPLRVANYFVKPQTTFTIPPTCNVMFPGMVRSLAYSENYRSTLTRLYLNEEFIDVLYPGTELGKSALTLAYPPQAAAALQAKLSVRASDPALVDQAMTDTIATGKNILVWPEEFFKGPVLLRGQVPTLVGLLVRTLERPGNDDTVKPTTEEVQRLLNIYAEYDFFRQRYAQRGGSADMVFNPYVVPGYPGIIFDREGGLHQVGYINSVSHSLSSRGMSTSVSYSHGRTLNEWVSLIKSDSERLGVLFGSGPIEPLDVVRQTLQDQTKAERHYDTLFHGGREISRPGNRIQRSASVVFQELLANHDGSAITVSGPTEASKPLMARPTATAQEQATATSSTPAKVEVILDSPLKLAAPFETVAKDTSAGLSYVARPICTLTEYVRFLHGDTVPADINVSRRERAVLGAQRPAISYDRIKFYVIGPGEDPGATGSGVSTGDPVPGGTTPTAAMATEKATALPSGSFPQTRADWDSILLAYREEVRTRVEPSE